MAKLNPIQGNVMSVGIHMTVQTITQENGSVSTTEEDFYPNTDYPVLVVLKKGGTKYPYTASVDGYMVYFEDEGSLPVGKYQLEVLCRNNQGQPMRFMERDVIEVHDATADAGVEAGVEFDVQTYSLNGVVFVAYSGGGGSQVQSDWNETDETSMAYIQNKPTIPTKTSELTNDSGFLTEHQSLAGYVQTTTLTEYQSQVTAALEDKADKNHSHTASEISDLGTVLSGFVTTTTLETAISGLATVARTGSYNDLTQKPTIPTKTSELTNDSGYLTEHQSLSGYVTTSSLSTALGSYYTKSEIDNKGYLTEHQSLAGYVTTTTLSNALAGYVPASRTINGKPLTGDVSLSASDVGALPDDTAIPSKTSELTNDSGFLTEHQSLANYYTKTETDTALADKADKAGIVEVSGDGAVTQELAANTFYKFTGTLTQLDITLAAGTGLCVYAGKFTADSNGCTFGYPQSVTAASSVPTIEGGKTYEFNIVDNVLLMVEV